METTKCRTKQGIAKGEQVIKQSDESMKPPANIAQFKLDEFDQSKIDVEFKVHLRRTIYAMEEIASETSYTGDRAGFIYLAGPFGKGDLSTDEGAAERFIEMQCEMEFPNESIGNKSHLEEFNSHHNDIVVKNDLCCAVDTCERITDFANTGMMKKILAKVGIESVRPGVSEYVNKNQKVRKIVLTALNMPLGECADRFNEAVYDILVSANHPSLTWEGGNAKITINVVVDSHYYGGMKDFIFTSHLLDANRKWLQETLLGEGLEPSLWWVTGHYMGGREHRIVPQEQLAGEVVNMIFAVSERERTAEDKFYCDEMAPVKRFVDSKWMCFSNERNFKYDTILGTYNPEVIDYYMNEEEQRIWSTFRYGKHSTHHLHDCFESGSTRDRRMMMVNTGHFIGQIENALAAERGFINSVLIFLIKIADGNQVSVICGKDPKKANAWTFPVGKMEEGEDMFMTAARELREETGYELPGGSQTTFSLDNCVEYVNPEGIKYRTHLVCAFLEDAEYVGPVEGKEDDMLTDIMWYSHLKKPLKGIQRECMKYSGYLSDSTMEYILLKRTFAAMSGVDSLVTRSFEDPSKKELSLKAMSKTVDEDLQRVRDHMIKKGGWENDLIPVERCWGLLGKRFIDGDKIVVWPSGSFFWKTGLYSPFSSRNDMLANHSQAFSRWMMKNPKDVILFNPGVDFIRDYPDQVTGMVRISRDRLKRNILARSKDNAKNQPVDFERVWKDQEEMAFAIEAAGKPIYEGWINLDCEKSGLIVATSGAGKSSYIRRMQKEGEELNESKRPKKKAEVKNPRYVLMDDNNELSEDTKRSIDRIIDAYPFEAHENIDNLSPEDLIRAMKAKMDGDDDTIAEIRSKMGETGNFMCEIERDDVIKMLELQGPISPESKRLFMNGEHLILEKASLNDDVLTLKRYAMAHREFVEWWISMVDGVIDMGNAKKMLKETDEEFAIMWSNKVLQHEREWDEDVFKSNVHDLMTALCSGLDTLKREEGEFDDMPALEKNTISSDSDVSDSSEAGTLHAMSSSSKTKVNWFANSWTGWKNNKEGDKRPVFWTKNKDQDDIQQQLYNKWAVKGKDELHFNDRVKTIPAMSNLINMFIRKHSDAPNVDIWLQGTLEGLNPAEQVHHFTSGNLKAASKEEVKHPNEKEVITSVYLVPYTFQDNKKASNNVRYWMGQRRDGGVFPIGGKVEDGESHYKALVRECTDESLHTTVSKHPVNFIVTLNGSMNYDHRITIIDEDESKVTIMHWYFSEWLGNGWDTDLYKVPLDGEFEGQFKWRTLKTVIATNKSSIPNIVSGTRGLNEMLSLRSEAMKNTSHSDDAQHFKEAIHALPKKKHSYLHAGSCKKDDGVNEYTSSVGIGCCVPYVKNGSQLLNSLEEGFKSSIGITMKRLANKASVISVIDFTDEVRKGGGTSLGMEYKSGTYNLHHTMVRDGGNELVDSMVLWDIDPAAIQAGRIWNKFVVFDSTKARMMLIPYEIAVRSGLVKNADEYAEREKLLSSQDVRDADTENLCLFYFRTMLSCVTVSEAEMDGYSLGHVLAGANWANQLSPRLFSRSQYGMLWFTDEVKKMLTMKWKHSLPIELNNGRLVSVVPLQGFIFCSATGLLKSRLLVEATSQIYVVGESDSMLGSFSMVGGQNNERVLRVVICGPGTDVAFAESKGGMRNYTGYKKDWVDGETIRSNIEEEIMRDTIKGSKGESFFDKIVLVRSTDHLPHSCKYHVYGVFTNESYRDPHHADFNDMLKEYASKQGIPHVHVKNGQHLVRKIKMAAMPMKRRSKFGYVVDRTLWTNMVKSKGVTARIVKCSKCVDELIYWTCNVAMSFPVSLREPKDGDIIFIPGNHCSAGAGLNLYLDAVHAAIVNVSIKTRKRSLTSILGKLNLAKEGIDVSGHLLAAKELPVTHFCLYVLSIIMNLVGLYQSGGLYKWGEGQPHIVWHKLEDYRASVLQAESGNASLNSPHNRRSHDLLSVISTLLQDGNFVDSEIEDHRFIEAYNFSDVADWNFYDLATLFVNWFVLNWDN